MIIGYKPDWETFKQKHSDKPDKLKAIEARLQWLTPNIWYVPDEQDSKFERQLLRRVKLTGVIPNISWSGTQEAPTAISIVKQEAPKPRTVRSTTVKTVKVPHKKPPTLWRKVASYWRAVSGPKLSDEKFNKRLECCTAKGGYSWAKKDGTVDEVGLTHVTIGGVRVDLPEDERPKVKQGDVVVAGQTIAEGETKKPCPLLLVMPNKCGTPEFFCNGCGCGTRTKAELHSKLRFAKVECPRTPPQFTAEENA